MPQPVAYLRKSKSDDPTKEVSRDVQEHAVRELAARDRFTGELALYVDWDKSADESKANRRTAFLALTRAIEAGEVSTLYAYSMDRLYRSLATYVRLTEAANAQGVRIVTTREGVIGGDGSPMALAFAQMTAVFGEVELNTAKARARSAYQSRVRRGDYVGQAPYGSRLAKDADGRVVLAREPSEDLAAVLDAYRRSGSRARVAVRYLNDELHLPSPYGRLWDRRSVVKIIEREAPELLPQRTATGRRQQPATPALFAKLLRCHCGRLLTPNRRVERRPGHGNRERVDVSYYCARGHSAPVTHGRPYYVSEQTVRPWIEAEAARLVPFGPRRVDAPDADGAGRLTALAERKRRLALTFADGALEEADYRTELANIAAEAEHIETAAVVVELPPLDWSWPTEAINDWLRALWRCVQLDSQLRPVAAEWVVSERRAA
jgi:DNA invertase Pin-like site-specific DNA recombinase